MLNVTGPAFYFKTLNASPTLVAQQSTLAAHFRFVFSAASKTTFYWSAWLTALLIVIALAGSKNFLCSKYAEWQACCMGRYSMPQSQLTGERPNDLSAAKQTLKPRDRCVNESLFVNMVFGLQFSLVW